MRFCTHGDITVVRLCPGCERKFAPRVGRSAIMVKHSTNEAILDALGFFVIFLVFERSACFAEGAGLRGNVKSGQRSWALR